MVTLNSYGNNGNTYYGLNDDTKPTTAGNGDCYVAMDAGKVYFYDESTETWLEWGASS